VDLLIGWEPFEITFRGSKVSMTLRPLRTDAFQVLFPYMKRLENVQENAIQAMELQGKLAPVFRDHVKDISGITINGMPPTPEDLATEIMLIGLAQSIAQELFTRSSIMAIESKNLEPPSGQS